VRTRLKHFDMSIIEASIDLGASEIRTFFRITLPVIFPGVLAGALLAFTLSVDEFIIANFTAGASPSSTTFPMRIYAMIRFGVTPEIKRWRRSSSRQLPGVSLPAPQPLSGGKVLCR
jgi:spermidine/putrescine transport system permease protein